MQFKILSRYESERIKIEEPHIWISVADKKLEPAKLMQNKNCFEILYSFFEDTNNQECISNKDCKDIIKLVLDYKDKVDLICVNCMAGVSRSAGIASALSLWLNGHTTGIEGTYKYFPNVYVKCAILKELQDQKIIKDWRI